MTPVEVCKKTKKKKPKPAADSRSFAPPGGGLSCPITAEKKKIKVAEADWVIDHADLRCATYM